MAGSQSKSVTDMNDFQFAETSPIVEFPIYPVGDAGGFHFQNDPDDPYQRGTIIQRKGRVNIGCDHKDIVHGYLSEDDDADLCTLIIVQFRFDPNSIATRIKEAHAVFKFAAMEMGKPDPEVIAMYPEGSFFVEATTQHEQVVKGAEANFGGGAAGAQVGGSLKLEKIVDRERMDFTRVRGSIDVLRGYGKKNAVSWDLFENPTAQTGIVTSLQGAIMLKRRSMDPFKASISLQATADTISRISAVFKKDEKDDDIWYDPKKSSTNKLHKYDVENLGTLDLKSLSDVTFRTVLKNAVREQ
ncbi:MAG: hypothetical protein Q9187_001967 [Circinaria calcarea]